jgi:hypothetical protein
MLCRKVLIAPIAVIAKAGDPFSRTKPLAFALLLPMVCKIFHTWQENEKDGPYFLVGWAILARQSIPRSTHLNHLSRLIVVSNFILA